MIKGSGPSADPILCHWRQWRVFERCSYHIHTCFPCTFCSYFTHKFRTCSWWGVCTTYTKNFPYIWFSYNSHNFDTISFNLSCDKTFYILNVISTYNTLNPSSMPKAAQSSVKVLWVGTFLALALLLWRGDLQIIFIS